MSAPTLLILAAGMGSRYGGLKQMDAFGPNGETILDYSIYDAIRAGFKKVVFVIRKSFSEEFQKFFANKFEDKVEVSYIFQELDILPNDYVFLPERSKPWGTAHAVWVAKNEISGPFAVINADDFYGRSAYDIVANFLNNDKSAKRYALVAYQLKKTMSEHGTVNRGVCTVHADQTLKKIVETLKIGYDDTGAIYYNDSEGKKQILAYDTLVSMNMWAFFPDFFDHCGHIFSSFLNKYGQQLKSEFFIPLLIDQLISSGIKKVDVLSCPEEWFGVTYKDDKPFVMDKLRNLIHDGVYPENLWE